MASEATPAGTPGTGESAPAADPAMAAGSVTMQATPPVTTATAPAMAEPERAASAPRPQAPTAGQPFIPPRPVTPAAQEAQLRAPKAAPNAFAEAAMENGAAQTEKRRGRSLFQKVTGAVNSLVAEEDQVAAAAPATPTPSAPRAPAAAAEPRLSTPAPAPAAAAPAAAEPAPAPAAAETNAAPAAPAEAETAQPAPAQPSLTNLEPESRPQASGSDDDMLEIPAFLRRQAN